GDAAPTPPAAVDELRRCREHRRDDRPGDEAGREGRPAQEPDTRCRRDRRDHRPAGQHLRLVGKGAPVGYPQTPGSKILALAPEEDTVWHPRSTAGRHWHGLAPQELRPSDCAGGTASPTRPGTSCTWPSS